MIRILKNKKGVTLVELLAVVIILGIIAAIAVPTIGGLIARQEGNADRATYNAIVEAALLYADGEDEIFTLATLQSADFIDLKEAGNVYTAGTVTGAANIFIKVDGNLVTFHTSIAVDPAVTFKVNDTEVQIVP